MRVLHPWRRGLTLVVVVLLGLVAWTGWQVWQVTSALSAATSDADELRAAVESGDDSSSDAALRSLQGHAEDASTKTQSSTWSLLARLPGVGDDAEGVRLVASVIDGLSTDGLVPLLRTADELDTILPQDGQVSIEDIEALQGTVATGNASLARADMQLQAADSRGFLEPLRTRYRELAAQVADASDALSSADTALRVLPTMLGRDGPRKYLLVFQNNAEVRATGGLPGSVSLLNVDDGQIELARQVAGNSFGRRDGSVLPLSREEKQLFGSQLGEFFLDANFTPDFPRAAELWKARWEETYSDDAIDGVLAIDPVALSYMLAATGPLEIDGVTLSEETAVDELLNKVYLRLEQPAEQDAFFQQVAQVVFDRVSNGAAAPRVLIEALARGADEGRVFVRSFDPAEAEAIAGRAVAGELTTSSVAVPSVVVALNDSTGAKMSYYLRSSTRMVATSCTRNAQRLAGRTVLESVAPGNANRLPDYVTGGGRYGVAPGDQIVTMQVFAPAGGSFVEATLNAEPVDVDVVRLGERDVATFSVSLSPGEVDTLSWQVEAPVGYDGPVDLRTTPGVLPGTDASSTLSACV